MYSNSSNQLNADSQSSIAMESGLDPFGLPVFLSKERHKCLIVGGSYGSLKKVEGLRAKGISCTTIFPILCNELTEKAIVREITCHKREFISTDIQNHTIAVAATNSEAVNREISQLSAAQNILCCSPSNPCEGNSLLAAAAEGVSIALLTSYLVPDVAISLKHRGLEIKQKATWKRGTNHSKQKS